MFEKVGIVVGKYLDVWNGLAWRSSWVWVRVLRGWCHFLVMQPGLTALALKSDTIYMNAAILHPLTTSSCLPRPHSSRRQSPNRNPSMLTFSLQLLWVVARSTGWDVCLESNTPAAHGEHANASVISWFQAIHLFTWMKKTLQQPW